MIAEAIDCFAQSVTIKRTQTTTTFVKGIAQPVTDTIDIPLDSVSVQPMKSRERLVLPELIRDTEMKKLYTQCELRTVEIAGKLRADRITYKGLRYVIHSVDDWECDGGYFKFAMVKENN